MCFVGFNSNPACSYLCPSPKSVQEKQALNQISSKLCDTPNAQQSKVLRSWNFKFILFVSFYHQLQDLKQWKLKYDVGEGKIISVKWEFFNVYIL